MMLMGGSEVKKIESAQTIYKQISINHHPQFLCLSHLTWVSDQLLLWLHLCDFSWVIFYCGNGGPFCRCFIIPHVYPHGWCRKASAFPSILFLHGSSLEIQRGLEQLALKVLPSVLLKKTSPRICCNAVCEMKAPGRTKSRSFWRGRCVVWCCWNLSSCRGEGSIGTIEKSWEGGNQRSCTVS